MKRYRYTYPLFVSIVLLLLSACTKDEIAVQQTEGPKFVIGTKAPDGVVSPTTFQIMAYGAQQENLFNCISSGAYTIEENKENKFGDDFYYLTSTKPLVIPLEQVGKEFYVSYVSPAMDHTDGGFKVENLNSPFYSSDLQKKELWNYGLVEIKNPLVDRRAKIGFRFYKDKKEKDIVVENKNVQISGVGNVYWPATKQVTIQDTISLNVEMAPAQENTDTLLYVCTESERMPFILSGVYSPKDSVAAYLNEYYSLGYAPTNLLESNYLYAVFSFSVNGGGMQQVRVPLTSKAIEILPLNTYIYNITLSENYIHLVLEIVDAETNDWENGGYDTEIKDNTTKIDLGSFKISAYGWDEDEDNKWGNTEIKNNSGN